MTTVSSAAPIAMGEVGPLAEALLHHAELEHDGLDPYLVQVRVGLRGSVDGERLRSALEAVVARHPGLRSAFRRDREGTPVQVVWDRVDLDWDELDVADESGIAAYGDAERTRGFDLREPGLLRARLVRGGGSTALVLTLHHVIVDGWSMPVLLRDLVAHVLDADHELPWIAPDVLPEPRETTDRDREVWSEVVAPLDSPTLLAPAADDRSATPGVLPVPVVVDLGDTLLADLDAWARESGVGLNVVMQAAWAITCGALLGRESVAFGLTVSVRDATVENYDALVGLFVNTVPSVVDVSGGQTVMDLLEQVRRSQLTTMDHQHTGLGEIQGLAGRGQLFDSVMLFENYPIEASATNVDDTFDVASIQALDATHYPVTVVTIPPLADPARPGGTVRLDVDTERVDARTARAWSELFARVLGQLVDAADRPLATLRLTEPSSASGERWSEVDALLPELLVDAMRRNSGRTAVSDSRRHLTYAELEQRSDDIAALVRGAGLAPGAPVAIAMRRGVGLVEAAVAVVRSGRSYVPVDPAYPAERVAQMFDQARPGLILTDPATAERIAPMTGQALVVALQPDTPPATLGSAGSSAPTEATEATEATVTGSDLAYTIFTSGSTGRPKGVMIRHDALANLVSSFVRTCRLTPEDRWLAVTTFAFDIAALELFGPLVSGAELVVADEDDVRDMDRLAAVVRGRSISVMQATPSLWAALLEHDPTSLRDVQVLTGGEALPPALATALAERVPRVLNVYGPTETTIWSTASTVATGEPPTIGHVIDRTTARVLDPALREVPRGAVGELYLGGIGLAQGYLDQAALTAGRFVADPLGTPGTLLYRTGDLATLDHDGRLVCLGRADDQVKVRGHRIELGEVEVALRRVDGVRRSSVKLCTAAGGRTYLAGYVVLDPSTPVTPEAIRESVARWIPGYMVPERVVVLAELPQTPNGKVDRRALPEPAERVAASTTVGRSPEEDALLGVLCSELSAVFDGATVDPDDDFYRLGGDSLMATRLVNRLRRTLDVDLAVDDLLENPTARGLAGRLRGSTSSRARPERLGLTSAPLSRSQRGLWLIDQATTGPSAYVIRLRLDFARTIAADALAAAVADLVERHETLRTLTEHRGTEVVQQVLPVAEALRHRWLDHGSTQVVGRRGPTARFDLARELPVRLTIIEPGPGAAAGSSVAVLEVHHTAADGMSVQVLVSELQALYRAHLDPGSPADLEPVALQFLDIATWQEGHAAIDAEHLADQWRTVLDGAPAELDLPWRRHRPDQPTGAGETLVLHLDPCTHQAVLDVAAHARVTVLMVLQAAVAATYEALGAGRDVVLGTAVHGRAPEVSPRAVGMFANTVATRIAVRPHDSFVDLLAHVRSQGLEAYRLGTLPFDQVVAAVAPERVTGRHPIFQSFVALSRETTEDTSSSVFHVTPLPAPSTTFDLSWEFVERRGTDARARGIDLHLEYSLDLFTAPDAGRIAETVLHVLGQLAAAPERPLHRLSAVLPDRAESPATTGRRDGGPLGLGTYDRFAAWVQRRPHAVAVVDEGSGLTWTYGDLDQSARRTAAALRDRGVGRGDVVAFLGSSGATTVATVLGIWSLGAVYLPIDPAQPADRLRGILRDARAVIVLHDGALSDESVLADPALTDPVPSFDVRGLTESHLDASDLPDVPLHAEAYLLFTSGSTGAPKGALLTHAGMVNHLLAKVEDLDLDDTDAVMQNAPLTFDISIWQMFLPLILGGRVVVPASSARADPDALAACCERHHVTVLEVVPSLLRAMRGVLDVQSAFADLRWMVATGEALPTDLADWWTRTSDVPLVNAYGPTECSDDVTHAIIRRPDPLRRPSAPIGVPVRGTTLHVLDDSLRAVPVGVVGELYVGGVGVGLGYHGQPGLTASRFVADPDRPGERLYRTGDEVAWRPDGQLEFRGRRDGQVKIRGSRIELGEIEAAARSHPSVGESVVLLVGDAGDASLVGFVEAAERPHDLHAWIAARVPAHMQPRHWIALPQLTLTANGKVDRSALAAAAAQSPHVLDAPARETRAAANDEETFWCELFAATVPTSRPGPDDDFFLVGGDSIRAIELVGRARQRGRDLTVGELLMDRTPAALARRTLATVEPDDREVGELPPLVAHLHQTSRGGSLADDFTQEVTLRVPAPVDADAVRTALADMMGVHAALRMRRTESGWSVVAPAEVDTSRSFSLHDRDVADLPDGAGLLAQARARIDSASGTMIHARLADGDRLLAVVAHHGAVDQLSWNLLLQELVARTTPGAAVPRPPITSYRRWAEAQHDAITELDDELTYWTRLGGHHVGGSSGAEAGPARRRWATLDVAATGRLLQAAEQHQVGLESALLAATGLALDADAAPGGTSVVVELESHGRTSLAGRVDVSRTVGWFTSAFPFAVRVAGGEMSPEQRAVQTVRAVSADRRRVPDEGVGFGILRHLGGRDELQHVRPDVVVNYLGDTTAADRAPGTDGWQVLPPAADLETDGATHPTHALSVDASLVDEDGSPVLRVRLESARSVADDDADRLAERLLAWLEVVSRGDYGVAADPIRQDDPFRPVVELARSTTGQHLFCVHGGVGFAWPYVELAPFLPSGVGLVGLQADFDAERAQPERTRTVADLARRHLALMRTVQPHGPYLLLGWSFGGLVAQELAALLHETGEDVAFLGVLDMYPGGGQDREVSPSEALGLLLGELGADVELPELREAIERGDLAAALTLARRPGALFDALTPQRLQGVLDTIAAHHRMAIVHRPRPAPGDLWLVSADHEAPAQGHPDPGALWAPVVEGEVRLQRVAALHDDLLRADVVPGYAPGLAAAVGAALSPGGR